MTAPLPTQTPPPSPQTTAYEAQQAQLRGQLLGALAAIWLAITRALRLPSPGNRFDSVRQLVPVNLGAQRTMVAMVVAELQRQTGAPLAVPVDKVTGASLRGVPMEQVYLRSLAEVERQLALRKPPEEAFDIGRRRLEKAALTDLQLAQTHTVRDFATQLQARRPDTVVGFRRVLSSNPNHCALCILASTQRYRSFDLMPIHPNCGCRVAMIMGDQDPGQVVDPQIAEQIHDIIRRDLGESYVDPGGRRGLAHYRDIIVTNQHGELGPVLGVRGQHFTGPDELRLGHTRVNPDDDPSD